MSGRRGWCVPSESTKSDAGWRIRWRQLLAAIGEYGPLPPIELMPRRKSREVERRVVP